MTNNSRFHRLQSGRIHIAFAAVCILAMLFAPANAQNSWSQAGIIIDYGDDRITWVWVPFEGTEPSLYELLDRSELEWVTVGFGGLGEAVCQIDDTGCPTAECRTRMCQTSSSSPFWRLMKLNDDEWSMIGAGVSGAKASDGDIFALSWSSQDPELPVVTLDELASNAGADRNAAAPVSALHTDGESSQPQSSPSSWAAAAGALGLVVVTAGVLVLRARSSHQDAA